MRLSPSVGGLTPREVLPGSLQIEGHHFPASTVSTPISADKDSPAADRHRETHTRHPSLILVPITTNLPPLVPERGNNSHESTPAITSIAHFVLNFCLH